jgi:hypothetical protein
MNNRFIHLLLGKDLRKLKNNKLAIESVTDQESFDELFTLVFHHERPLVMRAVDAVEKITRKNGHYLDSHKIQLLSTLKSADHKELRWHIAQLLPRIPLTLEEQEEVWHTLVYWARNPNESKIVRVNALQGLSDLSKKNTNFRDAFKVLLNDLSFEPIPSLQARIRKLKSQSIGHA